MTKNKDGVLLTKVDTTRLRGAADVAATPPIMPAFDEPAHFMPHNGQVPCGVESPDEWTFVWASVTCSKCLATRDHGKRFWVSWYASDVSFMWNKPWWISGETAHGQAMICAAVIADNEEHAKTLIIAAHDTPVELEWRFVNARDRSWSPFGERFPKADWMQWP